jgi:hypothetical protein
VDSNVSRVEPKLRHRNTRAKTPDLDTRESVQQRFWTQENQCISSAAIPNISSSAIMPTAAQRDRLRGRAQRRVNRKQAQYDSLETKLRDAETAREQLAPNSRQSAIVRADARVTTLEQKLDVVALALDQAQDELEEVEYLNSSDEDDE